jgi:hypothetical protein
VKSPQLCTARLACRLFMVIAILAFAGSPACGEGSLPVGSSPPRISAPHFPDRLHAVIWRNWQLVEPARIAKTVGAAEDDITRIAASMGLPPAGSVPADLRRRGYITILRRNWHLLPYDQLLTLLDMTSDQLAFALREDDFLYTKLGGLKPRCDLLVYRRPDAAAAARAAEIKRVVEQHFGGKLVEAGEPRFGFIDTLSRTDPAIKRVPADPVRIERGLRLVYSYFGGYGDPLADASLDPYPEGLLARLADVGVNGIWLHVVLRQLAPGGPQFPEFGQGHEGRLAGLRRLVERAKRHGIGVYLYINEPRAMPNAFFKNRPEMAGVREAEYTALCTSDERVRRWLGDSLAYVFRETPDLAGVFTITASENLTNCASHGHQKDCPRCSKRTAAEIIAEVNATIAEGVHRGNPQARVIAWDWGWNGHGDATETIAKLPKSVSLMSVSEWGLPIDRGGIKTTVGEYSLSAVGPGPRAAKHWALAHQRGLQAIAKVQFNCTWELSAVPYLPVLDLVAKHCENLQQAEIDGMMLSWTLGGYPSPNLRVAEAFSARRNAVAGEVLDKLAADLYGPGAEEARAAWTEFSKAFAEFPFDGELVYRGPQQLGPANLLYAEPTGYAATMVGFPYDDLKGWRGPYPAEVFAGQFEKVAAGWEAGLRHLEKATLAAPSDRRPAAVADLRLAKSAYLHFASTANQARFVLARDALRRADLAAAERQRLHEVLPRLVHRESDLAEQLFALTKADSRIGFEASNQYYYVPLDLVEKVISCEFIGRGSRRTVQQP